MNIYVANISFTLTEEELRDVFAEFGSVSSVKIIKDRETGRSRGFAFVEMDNDNEGYVAIQQLDGAKVAGRPLKVKQAVPKESLR